MSKKASGPRITVFAANMLGGGCERVLANLAIGLAASGERVELVLGDAHGSNLTKAVGRVPVIGLGVRDMRSAVKPLARYLRERKPAAVISGLHGTNISAVAAKIVSRGSTRLVATVHSVLSEEIRAGASLHTRLLIGLIPWAYRWVDAIVGVSKYVSDDLAHSTGLRAEKIRTIYNPVIPEDLPIRMAEPVGHPWMAEGEVPVVLVVGRLISLKNQEQIVRAIASVAERRKIRLLFLGEGPDRMTLTGLVQQKGLAEIVDFPGYAENIYGYLARGSLLVQASRREALPTVLIEALACGCPVVATDCPGGTREILRGGELGQLVPPADDRALAVAIETALEQGRVSARTELLAQYTIAEASRNYRTLIDELVR